MAEEKLKRVPDCLVEDREGSVVLSRRHGGIVITSSDQKWEMDVYPSDDQKLGIRLAAEWDEKEDRWVTVFPDNSVDSGPAPYYGVNDLRIDDTKLQAYIGSDYIPGFKEGFTLLLEPGMAVLLRRWIPRVLLVGEAIEKIESLLKSELQGDFRYMRFFHNPLCGSFMFDQDRPFADLINSHRKLSNIREEDSYDAMFDTPAVMDILRDLADRLKTVQPLT